MSCGNDYDGIYEVTDEDDIREISILFNDFVLFIF